MTSRPGPGGWPALPALGPTWMARRAAWWLRLMLAGRVHRFHADLTMLTARRAAPRPGRLALLAYADLLRQEWRARTEAGPAGPALLRAAHPNYLGSRPVVRGLVDGYIALLIARAGGKAPHEACAAEVRRLAGIFAGAHPRYAPIGGWNTRPQLGDTAIRRVPLGPEGTRAAPLDLVLQETFAAVGLATFRILRAAEQPEFGADAALARLSLLAERTTALLLGTADSDPDDATILALVQDLPDSTG